jgi:hypothetical protein
MLAALIRAPSFEGREDRFAPHAERLEIERRPRQLRLARRRDRPHGQGERGRRCRYAGRYAAIQAHTYCVPRVNCTRRASTSVAYSSSVR